MVSSYFKKTFTKDRTKRTIHPVADKGDDDNQFDLDIDVVNDDVLVRNAESMLGCRINAGEVLKVDKNSAAERAGLRKGHQIVELNGVSVVDASHASIVVLLTHHQEVNCKVVDK
eukprot:Pgem_evm1s3868